MKRITTLLFTLVTTLAAQAIPAFAAPAAPAITAPASGTTVCDPSVEFSGTADPSTTVRLEDGADVLGSTTADEAGAWTTTVDLADGDHSVAAIANDGAEDSPASAPVTINVLSTDAALAGSITASYATISPRNQDGTRDATTLSTTVSRAGALRFQIYRNSALVRQSASFAVVDGSTPSWQWNGKGSTEYNGAGFVSTGTYTVKAVWTGDGCTFEITRTIEVDNLAPQVSSFTDSPNTFYPREDDELTEFKDTTKISYTGLDGRAHVWLYIYKDGATTPIRKIDDGWDENGGGGSVSWNGRTSGGDLFPAGVYDYKLRLRDAYLNERFTSRGEVTLSRKRLDARTVTLSKRGDAYYDSIAAGCGEASPGDSSWSEGVLLDVVDCYYDTYIPDAVMTTYSFTPPSAPYHHSFTLQAHGYSPGGDSVGGLLRNYNTAEHDAVGMVGGYSASTRTFGTLYGSKYLSSGGKVRASLLMFDPYDCCHVAYDVKYIYLKVKYGVLVS